MENHEFFLFSFLLIFSFNIIKLILQVRDSIREKEKSTVVVPYSTNNEQSKYQQYQQPKYYYNFNIYENRYDKKYSDNNSGYKNITIKKKI